MSRGGDIGLVLAGLVTLVPSVLGATDTLPSPPQPPGAVVVAEVAEIHTPLRIVEADFFHQYTAIGLRIEDVLAGDAPDSLGVYMSYYIHIDGLRTRVEPHFVTESSVPILVPGQRVVVGVWRPDERSVPPSTPEQLRMLWRWWGKAYVFHERGGEPVLGAAAHIILAHSTDADGTKLSAEEIVARSRQALNVPYLSFDEVRDELLTEFAGRVEEYLRR